MPEALDVTHQIQDKYHCANALRYLLSYLGKLSISFDEWTKMLNVLAYQNRMQLLSALPYTRPIVTQLCDHATFLKVLKAVQKVCQQWP